MPTSDPPSRPDPIHSDKPRWALLGLADPPPDGSLPADATTADVLARGVTLPGAPDPVGGGVGAVRAELAAAATLLSGWARRLEAFEVLQRRADVEAPELAEES